MANAGMATAPEFQPPVCCFVTNGSGGEGSWMTPTRLGLPFGYGSERGAQGKGGVINVGAGSTNWSVRQGGPLAGGEKLVQGEGQLPLPQASASDWRARHSRS